MKKILTLLLFVCASYAFAQQKNENPSNLDEGLKLNPSDSKGMTELIIGVPKVNEKNLFILTDAIEKTNGMEYVMFCPLHRLLLIRYDKASFAKNEDVLNVFKQKNIVMPMFIKEGTFAEIKDLCNN